MSEKSSKKVKSKKNSKYVILNDKFVLNEDLVLERTYFDDSLIAETKQFLKLIQNCEQFQKWHNNDSKMKQWITSLEQRKYNNLYHLLKDIEISYVKNQQLKTFIEHLRSFYDGRNGFFTIDLFSEQPILDANFQLEKMRLEKNILSLQNKQKVKKMFEFLSSKFPCQIQKEKNNSGNFEFTYDELSFQNLKYINCYIEESLLSNQIFI